jgi:hypothetical protein
MDMALTGGGESQSFIAVQPIHTPIAAKKITGTAGDFALIHVLPHLFMNK